MENVTNNPWFNVPSGERLKICRKRMNLTHSQLMDKVSELPENKGKGRSEKQIGYIESGKRQMSAEYARLFAKVLGVQPSFLLCETDFETEAAHFASVINQSRDESSKLTAGLAYFLSLSDYKIVYNDIGKESMPVEEAIEWYTKKLVILKHGEREVYLSPFDLSDLENEILGYIELRLKYLLESKWRDEKNG